MTNSLYTEALADAKAVREAAEARAKQQLIEAMSPDIKLMVEKAILDEEIDEEVTEQIEEQTEEEAGDNNSSEEANDNNSSEEEQSEEESAKPTTTESEDPFEAEQFVSEVPVELAEDMVDEDEEVVEVEEDDNPIKKENRRLINKLVTKQKRKEAIIEKLDNLSEAIKRLRPAVLLSESNQINDVSSQKLNKVMHSLIKEFKILSTSRILKSDKQLFETYLKIAQEFMSMYKRRRNRLNESIDDIFEADFLLEEEGEEPEAEDPAEDKDDLDLLAPAEDEEGSEEEAADSEQGDDSDEDEDSVDMDDLKDALKPLMDLIGEDEPEAEEGEAELQDEGYEADMPEGMEEMEEMEEGLDEGDVYLEIDEDMLRNEISKMKAIREGDAADMAAHFGGGEGEQEPFVDGEELNKLDSLKESARKVVRHNRKLNAELKEHKKALRAMKEQLQEMNLFNAKLLYANKLMQNKDLSLKQQKHIVESLDNAKTLGEAKVLFEGLTKSLNKSSSRTGALTEGTSRRVLGTSSRSTRSAQPANNRAEVDRWALLAGIKG